LSAIAGVVRAPAGGAGGPNGRSGGVAPDIVLEVPLGTVVRTLSPPPEPEAEVGRCGWGEQGDQKRRWERCGWGEQG
jgi:hypothetical protein